MWELGTELRSAVGVGPALNYGGSSPAPQRPSLSLVPITTLLFFFVRMNVHTSVGSCVDMNVLACRGQRLVSGVFLVSLSLVY